MKLSNKQILIIAGIVFVILVAVAVFYYKKGKKQISTQYLPGDLPFGNPGNGGGTTEASNSEIKSIAEAMHEDMDGFNWSGHNMEPYQRALVLSDTDFVKLYNTFNGLYQEESKQTLKMWIENEKFYNSEITDTILNRMAKLNLV